MIALWQVNEFSGYNRRTDLKYGRDHMATDSADGLIFESKRMIQTFTLYF